MRPDLKVVADLIGRDKRVLDLGCGDGELLVNLHHQQGCDGLGVDVDPDRVVSAIARGVSIIELDIDEQLDEFTDDSFDVVVLSQTLQATRRPAALLRQMMRIAGAGVVSVPNFAWWRHRLGLLTRGRMPVSPALPLSWFDTPNIHLSSLTDLEALITTECGFTVDRRVLLDADGSPTRVRGPYNLLAAGAAYLIKA